MQTAPERGALVSEDAGPQSQRQGLSSAHASVSLWASSPSCRQEPSPPDAPPRLCGALGIGASPQMVPQNVRCHRLAAS